MTQQQITVELPDWAADFEQPSRYKVSYGGRGGAKSRTFAQKLVLKAYSRPTRIVLMREKLNSIKDSSRQAIIDTIGRMGLTDYFQPRLTHIDGPHGSYFVFRGMNKQTEADIKSLEGFDVCWFEEAQEMSARSFELLRPTIRKPGSELWFTFNPMNRSDAVWQFFVVSPPENAIVRKVSFDDNPWFRETENEEERLIDLRENPERYPHVWLGEPDDIGLQRQVLPFALLLECVGIPDGVTADSLSGRSDAGLDIGDGGDRNALAIRRGPLLLHCEDWPSVASELAKTTRRAHGVCIEQGIRRFYYDVGGPGAGVRSHLREMREEGVAIDYYPEGVNFGGEPAGKDELYTHRRTNGDHFAHRNAQMAWALRLRALNTKRLKDGENVNPANCLFIDERIPDLEGMLTELSQPIYDENNSGKTVIEKAPNDGDKSPNRFDAVGLAFCWDARNGLRVR